MKKDAKEPKDFTSAVTPVDRIRFLIRKMGITQGEFARRVGLDATNMSKHMNGKLPITEGLLNKIVVNLGVSKRWLKDGSDVPFGKAGMANFTPERPSSALPVAVPIYDVDVVAGTEELSRMFTDDRIIGHISMPRLKRNDVIVKVSGDSMMPVIAPGGYVAINPQNDNHNIFWGQIYVIVMDDYRLVKYLRKADSDDKVRLVSANPAYDDMIVDRSEIRGLYLVDAVINCELRC
ncbi:MAG: XRE family transcriptional regulator [Paramuribaculum sp.]|nr:XRE family transcriptional regulator [Paramuribaculum sp.]MDE6652180.1 XRE family transcriptional regulator [Paramuribaculum sp.]